MIDFISRCFPLFPVVSLPWFPVLSRGDFRPQGYHLLFQVISRGFLPWFPVV